MSQYSETSGSFVRVANYPLEANYIFSSEAELKSFFENPLNKVTLHKGLLKVVANESEQSLYWVVEKDENLEFEKLIENISLDNIKQLIEDLQQEVADRTEADSYLQEQLDTLDLILSDLGEQVNQNTNNIKEIVGCSDEDIIPDYLKTLDYNNLTIISETLKKFLNTVDNLDDKINTLPELQNFLAGYSDSDTLQKILEDLVKGLKGDANQFQTLGDIEKFLLTLAQAFKNRTDNLQTELDQTQVGVGLSGDGAYNADKETYYLQDATSVMNALKTLDRLIHRLKLLFGETSTIKLRDELNEDTNETTIYADVKLATREDNQIVIESDGLYHNVDIDYQNGIISLKVNGKVITTHDIGLSAIVEDSFYDTTTENIVIFFKLHNNETQRVEIPAANLIQELVTTNTNSIELSKERVINGPDKLTANLVVAPDNKLLEVKSTGVYVSNEASKMSTKYNRTSLEEGLGVAYKDWEMDQVDDGIEINFKRHNDDRSRKTIPNATSTQNGLLSKTDKTNLDSVVDKLKDVTAIVDKVLVTPVITSQWTIKNQAGDTVTLPGINLSSNSIIIETGYKVDYSGSFKWIHSDGKKDPTSVNGSYGTALPASNINSATLTDSNITANKTYTVNLVAPKKGLMLSGSTIIAATGNDTTKATAQVSFQHKRMWGVTTDPVNITFDAFDLANSRAKTITGVTANTTQYYYYAYPKTLGALTKITQNGAAPVIGDFNRVEKTIVNAAGASIVYYIYTTKNKGAFTNVELKFE